MVGFEVQKQGKYVNILPDRVNNSDLEVLTRDEKHVFLQFNFSDRKLPMQGFKIHISANLSNYQVVLNTVFSFCKVNSITFKYICNFTLLEKNIRGSDGDPTFSGKFITIYPATFNLFKTYIDMLYNIQELKTDSSIFVMTDRRYKDSNNIFYRYGAISRKDGYIVSPKGNKIRDSRKIGYQLPSFINEPFPNNYDDNLKGRYIFKKYIPKNSLNFKPSGSVFEVTNKYNNNVFIMKNAKVGFGDESYSVIDLLKKEKNNLINLRKANIDCIPRYIDDFYEDKDYFLIETKIDGENGDDFRASIKNNFKDGMLRKKTIQRYKFVVLDLMQKIEMFHKNNIYVGDISGRNIIIDKNNKVFFVDLPQLTFLNKENIKSRYRSKDFSDKEINFLSEIEQDNRQLGYLLIALFCRSNMFLLLDGSGKTTFNFFSKYASECKVPSIFVDIVYQLLFDRFTSLQKLINKLKEADFSRCQEYELTDLFNIRKLKEKLLKSIICAKIEHIKFENKEIYPRNYKDEVLSDFRKLQEKIYLNKSITSTKNLKLFQYVDRNAYQKLNYLEDWITILTCYISECKLDDKNKVDLMLREIFDRFKKNAGTKIYFELEQGITKFSPYLANGTAGILVLLLLYKRKFHTSLWDKEIKECVSSIKDISMPKSGGMYYGLAGIIYSLIMYTTVYKDKSFSSAIRTMLNNLQFYTINIDNTLFLIDGTFHNVNVSFPDGNLGLINVIKMAEEAKICFL